MRCCSSPAPTARRSPAELPGRLLHRRRGPRRVAGRRRHQRLRLRPQPVRWQRLCVALNNFWRSLSNLTINVTTPDAGCYSGEFWAVSQAAPMRRVHVNGGDHADGLLHGPVVRERRLHRRLGIRRSIIINGSQQQFLVRNSTLDGWSNGVWNQVFSGVEGAPAECFPAQASCGGPYTTLATSPVTREAPYLYVDADGQIRRSSSRRRARTPLGTILGSRADRRHDPSRSTISSSPSRRDGAKTINNALARGQNLHLHARHLQGRPDDQGEAARTPWCSGLGFADARARQRQRGDDGRRRDRRRASPG